MAANQRGISLIGELINQYGLDVVQAYMRYVQVSVQATVTSTGQNTHHILLGRGRFIDAKRRSKSVRLSEQDYAWSD